MFNKVVITGIVTSLIAYSFASTAFVAADSINPGAFKRLSTVWNSLW